MGDRCSPLGRSTPLRRVQRASPLHFHMHASTSTWVEAVESMGINIVPQIVLGLCACTKGRANVQGGLLVPLLLQAAYQVRDVHHVAIHWAAAGKRFPGEFAAKPADNHANRSVTHVHARRCK